MPVIIVSLVILNQTLEFEGPFGPYGTGGRESKGRHQGKKGNLFTAVHRVSDLRGSSRFIRSTS